MFNVKMSLPTADEIKKLYPLSQQLKEKKAQFDKEIAQNMTKRNKLTVVVGPCSADNPSAMSEYAQKVFSLQQSHPNLLVVARGYPAKPTTHAPATTVCAFNKGKTNLATLRKALRRVAKS